ncbi:MAG TPA: hypothetical protein GXZ24_07525 [Firmicutes bacterium]|jgi:uncharacterized membrane-anchored protein|nr:hypothetical protein [Bacillota bacterium]
MKKVAYIRGVVKKDVITKMLCQRLRPGDIALIAHADLDEIAAQELAERGVKAVINTCNIFSGDYPAQGTKILLEEGIFILDMVGGKIFSLLEEGERIVIRGDTVLSRGKKVARGRIMKKEIYSEQMLRAEENLNHKLDHFVQNTLKFARKEKSLILDKLAFPKLKTKIEGRHVLIVVRGKNYKKDLRAISSYIREEKPVLIGVDGGADALGELGFNCQIIIGDMDSVKDATLHKTGEIIVHAYPDGKAPGMARITGLGLQAKVIPAPGTSEDLAFLLAYEQKAALIVAVGSHSNMLDFLEKGRKGMASTFLVRLKIGAKLVDAKGLAHLYRSNLKWQSVSILLIAAFFPLAVLIALSPLVRHFLYLFFWKMKFF